MRFATAALLPVLIALTPLSAVAATQIIDKDTVLPASDTWLVATGDELLIAAGATLFVEGVLDIQGHLQVDGVLDAAAPAPALVHVRAGGTAWIDGAAVLGTTVNEGSVFNRGAVDLLVDFENHGSYESRAKTVNQGVLRNHGVVDNQGELETTSDLRNGTGALLINTAILVNSGYMENRGEIQNRYAPSGIGWVRGLLQNTGRFDNVGDALVVNEASDIRNDGLFYNDGEISNRSAARLINGSAGDFNNMPFAFIENSGGRVTNEGGAFSSGGNIINRAGSLIENRPSPDPLSPGLEELRIAGGGELRSEGVTVNERFWISHGAMLNPRGTVLNFCDGDFRSLGGSGFDNRGPGRVVNFAGAFTYGVWFGPLPIEVPVCVRR